MEPSTYTFLKSTIQRCSLFFAFFFNFLLIFLVQTKSPKKMGTYKYLMIFFSLFAIFFTCLENLIQPYGHTHGCTFLVIMRMEDSIFSKDVAFILVCLLNGCFAFTIYTIAIHFIFRFFALERKGRLQYFREQYLPLWFSIPLFFAANQVLLCFFIFRPTPQISDYVRETVSSNYNFKIDDQVYVGAYLYPPNPQGIPTLNWKVALALLNILLFTNVSFAILAYYGTKSYRKIQNLLNEGRSKYTQNLQKQLYKALVLQAIIPTVLMFIPIGIFIAAPIFNWEIEWIGKIATATYALYPAIDPIPIIFIVDEYQRATVEIFKLDIFKRNKIEVIEIEEPSNSDSSQNGQQEKY